jgi:hypothetical protein
MHVTSALEWESWSIGWQLSPITTVHNGVDGIEGFAPDEVATAVKERTAERPFILFFGRIGWKKGWIVC